MWDLFPPLAILTSMSNNIPDSSRTQTSSAGQPPAALVNAIRRLLRPLVHLMLSFQITYPFLINLLKSLYVEVAEQDFSVNNKRPTDSRINLLTGVHRKDVKRLRSETPGHSSMPPNISTGAQLIAFWLGSERFLDTNGRPLPLPLRSGAEVPEGPTFDDLVEQVCKQDIRPRVILDDWLHLGIAHQDDKGRIILNTGAFTPDAGFDEKVFFFGKNIHDHISASVHNLAGKKPAFFDRSVYYDQLSRESVDELATLANDAGMKALRSVNSKALGLQQRDIEHAERSGEQNHKRYRINFGIFNYNTHYNRNQENNSETGNPDQSEGGHRA